jgi:hypothetical protein
MGGASKIAARRAARHGCYFLPAYNDLYESYFDAWDKTGKPPLEYDHSRGFLMSWVAEDKDKFWKKIGPSLLH